MRVFNFAAGPATLPLPVLEQVREELPDWQHSGMSVMEISHRSKAFIAVAEGAEARLRALLDVPANYQVLFLQGGATGQFAAIPLNLAAPESTVDYVNTGNWSKKAIGEAQGVLRRREGCRGCGGRWLQLRAACSRSGSAARGAAYLHYTPNETIGGVAFPFIPGGRGRAAGGGLLLVDPLGRRWTCRSSA